MITSFSGEYRWLSNFWPVLINYEGLVYPSTENAYQASKTYPEYREPYKFYTPGKAKREGAKIAIRPDWDREGTMFKLQELKYKDPWLANLLILTDEQEIIEGNDWGDTFWGESPIGNGQNKLGKMIVTIRTRIKNR